LVNVRLAGAATRDDLVSTVAALLADPHITPDFSTLIDLREVTSVDAVSGGVVRELAAMRHQAVARCAFVAPNPAVFGLARMFASYREARDGAERSGVFRTISDAEAWLQVPAPSADAPAQAELTTRIAARSFDVGDHACAIYSSRAQLVRLASRFLAEGLERYEHCWYVGTRVDGLAIRSALRRRGVDADSQIRHGALRLVLPGDVYVVQDEFHPERTVRVLGDAVAQSQLDGFRGFRVVADMSWAATVRNSADRLVAYEASVRSMFTTGRLTALCLYHRRRLPLSVLNGALVTHPLTSAARGEAMLNPFYDREAVEAPLVADAAIGSRLLTLVRLVRGTVRRPRRA
jgi:hypothetical protein